MEDTNEMPVKCTLTGSGQRTVKIDVKSLDLVLTPGCYAATINHNNEDVGLPFSLCGNKHYFDATLIVTESNTEDQSHKNRLVGQTLIVPQCNDEKTHIYTRTLKSAENIWLPWSELQQNVEVGQVTSLDGFTSSGLYSGVYSVAGRSPETFVLTVIDNSTVAIASSKTRSISQFKYAVNVDGTFSYKTRVGSGDGKIEWGSWVDLGAADTTDIQDNSITAQKLSNEVREKVEQVASLCEMTNDALQADTVHMVSGVDNIHFCGRSIDGNNAISVEIPAATTENAGLMSARDKVELKVQAEKLIKLEGFAPSGDLAGITTVGQYYFNTKDNTIKRYDGSVFRTIPFHEGAVYCCKNLLYVWDGSELVLADKQIRDDLKAISIDTDGMLLAVSDRVYVEIGTLNISASGGNMSATNRFRTTSYIQPPFAITMSAGFIVKYICKYDSKGRYLGYSTPTSSSKVNMEDDAFLYRIMFAKSDGSDIGEEELDYAVANVKGKVTFLQESVTFLDSKQREFAEFSKQFTETQFVPAGFSSQIDEYYINGAGSMVSMDGFAVRTYTLDNVGLIKIEGTGGGVSRRYAFYSSEDVSENNVVLVGPKMDDTDFNEVIYVPDGAVMLAVTYRESWQQAIYVEKGKSVVPQFKRKKLKMLCFGNSFTIGSVGYVPFLMDKDIDLTIGIAFTSGGTLGPTYSGVENLYDKLTNDVAYTYFKYVNGAVSWVKKTVVPTEILADEDWDVVTLQQGSNNAPDYTTYQPYLNRCIDLISQKVNKPVKFGWIIPHADANVLSNDKETSILSAAERVMNDTIIQFIIPYGTAIANARKTAFSTIGDGGNLLYEGKHLQNGLPQLVANYSTLLSIYEIVGVNDKSIAGMTSEEITDDWVSNHKIPNASAVGTCIGVTVDNCRIAAKCAIMADKKPFGVTDITEIY